MQNWKFLLLGITGDLSKKKVLPALNQFAELNKDKLEIDLIGYSRSKPDESEIAELINSGNFREIQFVQGEYSDPLFFNNLLNQTSDRVVVYFAVPPSVFLDLLQTFCPFNTKNLDIIIEKPFGRDLEEAKKIIAKIKECKLERNVHFFDHYLFKPGTNFNNEILKNFKTVSDLDLKSVEVRVLESADVKGRGGFYDQTGAIRDMLPAHIVSLLKIVEKFSRKFKCEDLVNGKVQSLKLGQYSDYLLDADVNKSETETYFEAELLAEDVMVRLISGKKLDQKLTQIIINFLENKTLKIFIYPEAKIELYENGKLVKKFNMENTGKLDHTFMFEDLLMNNFDRFYEPQDALAGWEIYNKISDFQHTNSINLEIY